MAWPRNFMRLLLIIGVGMALLTGCSHTVEYDLDKKDKVTGRRINKVLEVKKFQEKIPRRENNNNIVKIDGHPWRTNVIRGYTEQDLAGSVSSMIATHLDQSGLFRNVIYRGADEEAEDTLAEEAQLVLTGKITEYTVMGRVNERAELKSRVGAILGTAGRIASVFANLDEETEVRVKVELKDVELKDIRTGKILWRDSVVVTGKYDADYEAAHPRGVYDRADACLKHAVSELIRRMAKRART